MKKFVVGKTLIGKRLVSKHLVSKNFVVGLTALLMTTSAYAQGAGQAGGDVIRFTGFAVGSTLELVGASGNARMYEVHDDAGLSEGQILVSAGGALGQVLTTSDYAFA